MGMIAIIILLLAFIIVAFGMICVHLNVMRLKRLYEKRRKNMIKIERLGFYNTSFIAYPEFRYYYKGHLRIDI